MEVTFERCCGMDVHKKSVVACVIVPGSTKEPKKEIRTFGTMTEDLLKLSDWLTENGVTHAAMESTGVYWKPIYNILEGNFEVLLVNAQHIKQVPGRKTDVRDCEWIGDLLRHGLLKGSFVPDREHREMRELTRYRVSLIRERTSEVNRVQKTLEGANIKLASVASDVLGKSGREMLEALLEGTMDAKAMADMARGKLRDKIPQLEKSLVGRFGAHQRFLLTQQLAHIDSLDETIKCVSEEIVRRLRPFEEAVERIDAIPGVGRVTAETIVVEIGTDMSRFPTAGHLASWAGMAPGNNESAGKRKSGKTKKGSPWLRSVLAEAAHAAGRTKDTYLGAQYHRLVSRRGGKKAAIAVGHSILIMVYHILKSNVTFQELGGRYFDQRDKQAVERRLVHRLEKLGYIVKLEPATTAA